MIDYEMFMKLEADKQDKNHEVELTQSEYDALTTEEKNNGKIYFVVDD